MNDLNLRFYVDFIERASPRRVLDFGCGDATLVAALRDRGIDAFGADVFAHGLVSLPTARTLVRSGFVRVIENDDRLPFVNASFDLIVSHMVFEHVADLQKVARELARVLAPDGMMYHQFATRDQWREGHVGVPFAHRVPETLREPYLRVMHRVGLGTHRETSSSREWARRQALYLREHCFYRTRAEVRALFEPAFEVREEESDYVRYRASGLARCALQYGGGDRVAELLFRRVGLIAFRMTPTAQPARA